MAFLRRMAVRSLVTFAGIWFTSAVGCAVDKDAPSETAKDTGGFSIDTGSADVATDTAINPDSACFSTRQTADVTPLHLFVMLDKSSSMKGTKWDGAKAGLAAFVKDADSTGIDVALNFFPRAPDATPACDQNAYKKPKVAFDLLPANTKAILDVLATELPEGFTTPVYPALGGAILGAIERVKPKPLDRGAVLLVTDGEPQGPAPTCGGLNPEDPAVIADLAKTGLGFSPSILTFVIGLPGVNKTFADQVAAAGGTAAAILVTDPTNVEAQFRNALNAVRGKALPCSYELSDAVKEGKVLPGFVNIDVTDAAGKVTSIARTDDCSKGGWTYDNPDKPTKIVLCPSLCESIRADYRAKISILLGCRTIIK